MKKLIIAIFIAIVALFGYFLLSQPVEAPVPANNDGEMVVEEEITVENTAQGAEISPSSNSQTENITISTGSLNDGQKKALETVGIEGDIEITPEMIACAEEKVGKERLDEIIAGDAPGLLEGMQLISCY